MGSENLWKHQNLSTKLKQATDYEVLLVIDTKYQIFFANVDTHFFWGGDYMEGVCKQRLRNLRQDIVYIRLGI